MTLKKSNRLENKLELSRKRKSLPLKKVAKLLGRSTSFQISRYEQGHEIPSLKTALKLAIIYNIPVHVLLEGYFKACREEIARESPSSMDLSDPDETQPEFCTIEEKLDAVSPSKNTLDKAKSHVAKLIRDRSEKLDHVSQRQ